MECPSCHVHVDGNPKFCPACGNALPQDAAPDPLVGTVLGGKYKVVRLLGEGGMGAVYLGEQQLGTKTRNVAIKTLHSHLSKDAKILARFEREVGTIAELEHPNTIQVYDFGKTEAGLLYIVMEYVQGRSLAEILEREGPMEPARVEKIMSQVCGSLEEAHARGIVHRDLKPDNIVLTERAGQKDWVKVLDFGIAKRSNEEDKNEQKLTQQGMVLGTPPYMSPEQFTGKPIDARSDIYSLAIMAYEMLTGRLPFVANTAWEWATQHMTAQPADMSAMPFHERVPGAMKDAIRRALSKSPDERFATVRAFFEAFSSGAAKVPTVSQAAAQEVGRAKTEVGTPLDFGGAAPPGAYGPPPGAPMGVAPGAPMQPVQAHYGTPAAGNVAFPTPGAGIPQAPPRTKPSGGNKGLLLGIAGVVGIASIGAIVFAMKGSGSSSGGAGLDLGPIDSGAPTAVLTAPTPEATPAATDPSNAALPPLIGAGPAHTPPSTGGKKEPGGKPEPSGKPAPSGTPTATTPAPTATAPAPTATTPAPTATTPPAHPAEPFECVQARNLKANPTLYQKFAKICRDKGGTP